LIEKYRTDRMLSVADYDYELPKELIAERPVERGKSRLLILNSKSGKIEDAWFSDLADILNYPVTVCRNVTAVVKTRIFANKKTGGAVEVFILNPYEKGTSFEALLNNAGGIKSGDVLVVEGEEKIRIKERNENIFQVELVRGKMNDFLEKYGHVPLPPYIGRGDEEKDKNDYQTVFAEIQGSSAAPTAGLHFTEDMLRRIKEKGASFADIVLHVGLGTFAPVKTEFIEQHKMHEEYFSAKPEECEKLNFAKKNKVPVLALGTTSLRVLETIYDYENKMFKSGEGKTDIFIYPPYKVKSADMMITNFHLPKSTLLMLVSAFAGKENIMNAYKHAIENRYRFFSYGDAMLIRS